MKKLVEEEIPRHIVNSNGERIELRAVSVYLEADILDAVTQEYRERGEPLDPPTYKVTVAGGAEIEYPHEVREDGKNTLDVTGDEAATAANHAAWEAYQDANRRLAEEANTRTVQATLALGVVCDEAPQEWIDQQRWLGVRLPDNPRDLRTRYITRALLPTPEDQVMAHLGIRVLSTSGQLDPERVEAIRRSFRDALRGGREPVKLDAAAEADATEG